MDESAAGGPQAVGREKKIRMLEGLASTDSPDMIKEMMRYLDDDDIQVRGEAFSSLVLNENNIARHLVGGLESASKNIRGFVSLVLANRHDTSAIPALVKLASDERSMVRSCAVGALGYMRASGGDARDAMIRLLLDDSGEVRKSAAHAVATSGIRVPPDVLERVELEWASGVAGDPDFGMLLGRLKA